jgi:hypothetical protein
MTSIARFDRKIQRGRGKASHKIGQTYAQYRLGSSTGSVLSGKPLATAFEARLGPPQKRQIENQSFSLLVFKATCDNRSLQLQDVLVENGYGAQENGVWTVAQMRPTGPTLWVRTEGTGCFISRPTPAAGDSVYEPDPDDPSGVSEETGYGGTEKDLESVLTLTNGLYLFRGPFVLDRSALGGVDMIGGVTPATIACGIQPLNRVRDGNALGTPTDLPRVHFVLYVPLLPGEQLIEHDIVNFPNADRYQVAEVFTTNLTGLSGYICIAEKMGT